jgi:hypothetical protein
MKNYRQILEEYWPHLALYAGVGITLFLLLGKIFWWFAAKAALKILGLALIGIGFLFRKKQAAEDPI